MMHADSDSNLIIRPARPDEIAMVIHHRRQMFTDMGGYEAAALDEMERASQAVFAEALRNGTYRGWFADAGGRVVAGGGVLLVPFQPSPGQPRPARPYIVNVYTEPGYRRRGLARRVMEEMVAWCRAQGYSGVNLHAAEEARPLYESMGFVPTNEMRLMFR
jgi:GNAT superfamily N-acetyltransferase